VSEGGRRFSTDCRIRAAKGFATPFASIDLRAMAPSSRLERSGLRRLQRREQPSHHDMIGDRSRDNAPDQETKRPSQIVGMGPPCNGDLEAFGRDRRRQLDGRCRPLPMRMFGVRRSAGSQRQLARAREPPPLISAMKPSLEYSDHALAFQPLKAAFNSLKIIVAGSLVGPILHDRMPVLAAWRLRSSKTIEVRLQGSKQILQWGHHGVNSLLAPPDRRFPFGTTFPGGR